MGVCELSASAAQDLADIAEYTLLQFSLDQARRYRDELQSCFDALAANPKLGRAVGQWRRHLRAKD